MKKKEVLNEIIGWYGALAIMGAYFLNSFYIIESNSFWYQFLNVTGAIGIVLISFVKKAYQSMVLNIIWVIIGTIALIKILS
ncbi:MAG: hypothetical protein WC810_25580 [Janthinobacterium sp.]|jgi:hypothetical protein